MNTTEIIQALRQKLKHIRQREFLILILDGLAPFAAGTAAILFIASLIEMIFRFSGVGRGIELTLIIGGISGLALYNLRLLIAVIIGKDRSLDDENIARRVGNVLSHIKDRLLNVLQLSRMKDDSGKYSAELIKTAVNRQGAAFVGEDFTPAASFEKTKKLWRKTLPAFLLVIVPALIFPNAFGGALDRISHPGREYPVEVPFDLMVSPGGAQIIRGKPFAITVRAEGKQPDFMKVYIQEEGTSTFAPVPVTARGDSFIYRLEKVTIPFTYYVQGTVQMLLRPDQHVKSSVYDVRVIHRPAVRRLRIRLECPPYSGLGSYYLADNIGDITAIKGTIVNLELTTNKTIREACLRFNDERQLPLEFHGTIGKGGFQLSREGTYTIFLRDNEQITNEDPIEYSLTFLPDEYPFVRIIDPGRDIDLDESMRVPLFFHAMDDYGLTKARLISRRIRYKSSDEEAAVSIEDTIDVPLNNPKDRMQDVRYVLDLGRSNLSPDDRLAYFIDVYDNDRVSGPKKTSSKTFYLRFPSMEEIFARVDGAQESAIEDMEEILEEHKAIREKIREIAKEMKRDPDLNWEKKRALKNEVEKQSDLMEKVMDVQKRYEEILEELEKHDLSSLETLKKYAELQKLFRDIMTPELQEAMENLHKSLEEQLQKKNELQKEVDQFVLSQDEMLKKIERTLNLLKHVQAEQKMDEIVKQAEELVKLQEEINKDYASIVSASGDSASGGFQGTDEEILDSKDQDIQEQQFEDIREKINELAQREQDLGFKTKEVEQNVKEMVEKARDDPMIVMPNLEPASNILEDRRVEERMQQASRDMRQGEKEAAHEEGERLQGDLQDFADNLRQARDELRANQKRQIMSAICRTMQDILELSRRQEQLAGETKNLDEHSPQFEEKAQEQMNIMSGLSRTAQQFMDLSQMTFFVTPQMGKSMGAALSEMQKAIKGLENRRSGPAANNQEKAMGGLNMTAKMMAGAMQNIGGSKSALGFQEYMKMLEQAASGQEGINKQTEQLMMGGQPQMSQQLEFMRLAREQAALQKLLEEIQKQMGERSDVLGRLGQIGGEMEEVAKELETAQVNRRTINRQRRILSRLLDAQRSLHRRDYSKKRQSQTAKDYKPTAPPALTMDDLNKSSIFQEELLKSLQEGYSKDFRKIIRKYYEALGRMQSVDVNVLPEN